MAAEKGMPPDETPIQTQLQALEERFRLIEEIDQSTTSMVARLAEAIQSSAEARALASLDVSRMIQDLATSFDDREAHHRQSLAELAGDIRQTRGNANLLIETLRELETQLATVQRHVSPEPVSAIRTVIVEEVPNAARALSIERFIKGLTVVKAVTARAFEHGVVRFDVTITDRDLPLDLAAESGGELAQIAESNGNLRYRLVDETSLPYRS